MANATIHVDVVSAEEQIYSGEAEFVVLPGMMGELGIYPRHTPLITRINTLAGISAGEKRGASSALHSGYAFVNAPFSFALFAPPAITVRARQSCQHDATKKGRILLMLSTTPASAIDERIAFRRLRQPRRRSGWGW